MKTTKFLGFLMGAAVMFASCNNEDATKELPQGEEGKGFLTVSLADAASGAFTRAVNEGPSETGSAEENKITNLEFYIFNSDGTLDSESPYLEYNYHSNSEKYTFSVTAGYKQILVAANMELGVQSGNIDAVREVIYNTSIATPLAAPVNGIPMAGEDLNVYAANGEVTSVTVLVGRLYAKFNAPTTDGNTHVDFTDAQKEELELIWGDKPLVGEVKFTLDAHYVINGLNQSFAFPNYGAAGEASRWDPNVWTIGNNVNNYISTVYDNNGQMTSAYSGDDYLTTESVYLYENSPKRTTDGVIGYEAATMNSMIVKGTLYDSMDNSNEITRYWRINLNKTDDTNTIYKILRNTIYNLNIQTIKTLGFGTPKEAEEDKKVIPDVDEAAIEVIIKPASWNVFNENQDI